MTLGERLRALRESRGQTQDEVGAAVGRTGKAVWAWENDLNAPRMGAIELLAQHFNVTKSYLMGEDDDTPAPLPSSLRPISSLHRQKVPLIGKVAAGQPIMAETDYETFVDSPVDCDAALEIEGESMLPTYLPGDIVYIKHQPTVRDGQVAVVLLDDSATLKHVYRDKDGLTLLSDNRDYPPIRVTDAEYSYVAIYGVPVGYTRIYKPDPPKKIKKGF